MQSRSDDKVKVKVCLGTNCYLKGSQKVLGEVIRHAEESGLENRLDVRASFCFEKCEGGPTVMIGDEHILHCTAEKAIEVLNRHIENDSSEQPIALHPGVARTD
jgi:NADH:ubiquinone oxidoreductase subunit E